MIAGKSLEETITGWILEERLTVSKTQDEKSDFHLTIPNAFGLQMNIDVGRPKGAPVIIIAIGIVIASQHKQSFLLLSEKEKAQFIFNLQSELLKFGVEYRFIPNVQEQEKIELMNLLYMEEISRPNLLKTIRLIRNVALFVISFYSNKFTSEMGPSSTPSGYG